MIFVVGVLAAMRGNSGIANKKRRFAEQGMDIVHTGQRHAANATRHELRRLDESAEPENAA